LPEADDGEVPQVLLGARVLETASGRAELYYSGGLERSTGGATQVAAALVQTRTALLPHISSVEVVAPSTALPHPLLHYLAHCLIHYRTDPPTTALLRSLSHHLATTHLRLGGSGWRLTAGSASRPAGSGNPAVPPVNSLAQRRYLRCWRPTKWPPGASTCIEYSSVSILIVPLFPPVHSLLCPSTASAHFPSFHSYSDALRVC
jgi:hypothetical protein